MLAFEDVSFSYHGGASVQHISFKIQQGEFVALLGANGAGKSTISKLANGLLKPSAGNVHICGMDTHTNKTSTIAKHVGMLFQNPDQQICQKTIAEEIRFSLACVLQDKAEIQRRLAMTLAEFQLEGGRDPFTMSRGDRQKIAFASVLACDPELLIIDEPTTGLDDEASRLLMEHLAQKHREGKTILMIIHDMELVLEYAQRVLVLKEGGLLADGTVHRVMSDPELLEKASLKAADLPALSQRLGPGYQDVFDVDTLLERLESRCL